MYRFMSTQLHSIRSFTCSGWRTASWYPTLSPTTQRHLDKYIYIDYIAIPTFERNKMNVDTLTWRTSTVIHWLHVCPRKSKVDQALLLDIFYMDHTKDPCFCFVLGFQHVVFCFLCYYLVWTKSCRWFSEQMGMFTKRWTRNYFFKWFPQYWLLNNCPANNPKINWDSIIKEWWLDGPLRYSQPGPSYLRMCYYDINRCNHIEYI